MKRRTWIALASILVILVATFYGFQKWGARSSSPRNELLSLMPAESTAVLFLDFHELRAAPFLAQLYAWAPKPQADPEYARFLADTGFDYERDLDRIGLAFVKSGQPDSTLFAVADGKFDKPKISAFALKTGNVAKAGSHDIFSVPTGESANIISFAFVRSDRIIFTNGSASDLAAFLGAKRQDGDATEWRSRFERLAGSPIFAMIRQDAALGAALAAQAPGGLRSPQLSTLLDQLQWITIAGKPEGDNLRIIAEGESLAEATTRQLADVLNGVLALAEAGLNDARTRQHVDPGARAAYLELVKNATVDKMDRGDTKSVRLTFEITPAFLKSAGRFPSEPSAPTTSKPKAPPGKPAPVRKGHT